ncbi:hypothetical protein GTCCBUS3UF5_20780 [Geobacillus thermoleovorans CCB_US3_UF5]|uniref:Uncharacterized protein n=2 Tax=Geobacillus thermoleovorans group TaxID=1505648 RepID=U2WS18_GEOKU|nr:hypothetical protein GTCCBUS3UF5_20780 [Geobacillus thermoleovorans CCB_US3_UF5]QOR82834.1 hypothetical protein IMZ17_09175 [Geobacillus stearothermophilus]GAD13571.1 hypothetical protein GBL_1788 [Geobacillus kaustophilus GBlys]GAJ58858.1 hypothetical protein B23_2071 [Geobacillus thermoleovorans B23]
MAIDGIVYVWSLTMAAAVDRKRNEIARLMAAKRVRLAPFVLNDAV